MPLNFKWVMPEEILAFFWPEEALLNRIYKIIRELSKDWEHPELHQDLGLLTRQFLHVLDHFYNGSKLEQTLVKWKPTPLAAIQEPSRQILEILETGPTERIQSIKALLPDRFVSALQERLKQG
jgi:hypothetical protein